MITSRRTSLPAHKLENQFLYQVTSQVTNRVNCHVTNQAFYNLTDPSIDPTSNQSDDQPTDETYIKLTDQLYIKPADQASNHIFILCHETGIKFNVNSLVKVEGALIITSIQICIIIGLYLLLEYVSQYTRSVKFSSWYYRGIKFIRIRFN